MGAACGTEILVLCAIFLAESWEGRNSSSRSSSSSSGACPTYGGSGRLGEGGATNAAIVHI